LGERLLCKQEVDGSIPFTSTTDRTLRSSVRVERVSGALAPRERPRMTDAIGSGEAEVCCWAEARRRLLFDNVKRE
jgi:hypothetical protein